MTNPLVFIDTETTGLHLDRRPWEIALIRREPHGYTTELRIFVDDVDLSAAELVGLNIGKFYSNHPSFRTDNPMPHLQDGEEEQQHSPGTWLATEAKAASLIERMTRGATLIGAVPSFDTECVAAMLRRHRLVPAWHYQPIDIEAMAFGYIVNECRRSGAEPPTLPIESDVLSKMCGVAPPDAEYRHTAIGDARWVQEWYGALIEGTA
ncbi:hypothetical protein [Rhodococcus sp. 14-2470-1a]|uniref:hypothetical protein n=1 Tax=Rhodococcus sp. 14-2470-1a TaxID=2023150 RepID=UPI000B9C0731|nr:hypothetical protein [Rhodococcus sp. 14-2470-1a]OZF47547.1 hypothetical protein CH292_19165 [Rhodococcus sp. 14-2470-1a]